MDFGKGQGGGRTTHGARVPVRPLLPSVRRMRAACDERAGGAAGDVR
ncbi:hypothetical protein ABT121_33880 [Streptomyces sp. NPDC001928]